MQERVTKTPRMVRKQLLLTREQAERVRTLASTMARPESELVREAVDDWLAKQKTLEEDWKSRLLNAAGMWADYPEIDRIMAEGRERRRTRRERVLKKMRGV